MLGLSIDLLLGPSHHLVLGPSPQLQLGPSPQLQLGPTALAIAQVQKQLQTQLDPAKPPIAALTK